MYNVYGVLCDTYEEACIVAGIDTPAQLRAEDAYWVAEDAIATQDDMEAWGGPIGCYHTHSGWIDDDIPF